ncbi:MAG: twin-arginine translocation signal domain-containing protein, partial [Planctomycetota bacterium]|nr:twin-arginine translocation signal domain-containing protein [Planctomycetota bacterium]
MPLPPASAVNLGQCEDAQTGSLGCESPTRRDFLKAAAALAVWPWGATWAAETKRPKVAAIFTEFTYRSHAHVILENFLEPYLFNGKKTDPGCDVVALFGDQFPQNEMSRDVAKRYGIPIYDTIAGALCRGGDTLAVDAVLS